mmetsp:Transcript_16965/g.36670  ORF Transcript_16965/g.36670 Transcript_16965/m.36670 type:complete len:117 (-) Transcript_16965:370-720(-)
MQRGEEERGNRGAGGAMAVRRRMTSSLHANKKPWIDERNCDKKRNSDKREMVATPAIVDAEGQQCLRKGRELQTRSHLLPGTWHQCETYPGQQLHEISPQQLSIPGCFTRVIIINN